MKTYPEFFYNLQTVYFVSEYDYAFMEKNQFKLTASPKAAGKDILVCIDDLAKIYGPYMEISTNSYTAKIEMYDTAAEIKAGCNKVKINGEFTELTENVELIDNKLFVPAGEFMKAAFSKLMFSTKEDDCTPGASIWPRDNTIVAISNTEEYNLNASAYTVTAAKRTSISIEPAFYSFINVAMRGKAEGELFKTYWFEPAKKVMPYSLYIPYKYDDSKPSKLVVSLHGGGLAEQYIYELSHNMMQFYCEEFNYIFLGPNACTKGSSYGCLIFNRQDALRNPPKPGYDPKNPYGISEDEIALRQLGDKSVMTAISEVMRDYNIDTKHIFLMGNSMGAIGTFHLPTVHKGFFRAIAPSGGCPDLTYFDLRALKESLNGAPVRMVVGTDDHHGFDYIKYGRDKLIEAGIEVDFAVVGGGVHYDAWAYKLKETFEFFEKF